MVTNLTVIQTEIFRKSCTRNVVCASSWMFFRGVKTKGVYVVLLFPQLAGSHLLVTVAQIWYLMQHFISRSSRLPFRLVQLRYSVRPTQRPPELICCKHEFPTSPPIPFPRPSPARFSAFIFAFVFASFSPAEAQFA